MVLVVLVVSVVLVVLVVKVAVLVVLMLKVVVAVAMSVVLVLVVAAQTVVSRKGLAQPSRTSRLWVRIVPLKVVIVYCTSYFNGARADWVERVKVATLLAVVAVAVKLVIRVVAIAAAA